MLSFLVHVYFRWTRLPTTQTIDRHAGSQECEYEHEHEHEHEDNSTRLVSGHSTALASALLIHLVSAKVMFEVTVRSDTSHGTSLSRLAVLHGGRVYACLGGLDCH